MSVTKLKVGDRVRLRGYCSTGRDVDGLTGKINEIFPDRIDVRDVRINGSDWFVSVKPSQIKSRLVKKPRREWYLIQPKNEEMGARAYPTRLEAHTAHGACIDSEIIQVREVRGKASKA